MRRLWLRLLPVVMLSVCLCGCEGLASKFRRQKKQPQRNPQEMIVVPEVYPSQGMDRMQQYEQAYVFWKGWHEELIAALEDQPNRKRVKEAFAETVKNLRQMRDALAEQHSGRGTLESAIAALATLESRFDRDAYSRQAMTWRSQAQEIYRRINVPLHYSRIKDSLQ